eukprot:TRINITY_DN8892_c0_g2_i2.p1 TRINITY_DN8892_c0_g2~~TRINITY_DN8892_c0_g2_i2.p1  ORF type:complete len:390 (+),score=64.10 TRINITY_DN8892_c0_g2_i2:579-1748(+)
MSSSDPSGEIQSLLESDLVGGLTCLLKYQSTGKDVSHFFPQILKLLTGPRDKTRFLVYHLLRQMHLYDHEWEKVSVPLGDDLSQQSELTIELRVQILQLLVDLPKIFIFSILFSHRPTVSQDKEIVASSLLKLAKTESISPFFRQTIVESLTEIGFTQGVFVSQDLVHKAFSYHLWSSICNHVINEKHTHLVESGLKAVRLLILNHVSCSESEAYEAYVDHVMEQLMSVRNFELLLSFIPRQPEHHQCTTVSTVGWLVKLYLDEIIGIPTQASTEKSRTYAGLRKQSPFFLNIPCPNVEDELLSLDSISGFLDKYLVPLLDIHSGHYSVVFQVSQVLVQLCSQSKFSFSYEWILKVNHALGDLLSLHTIASVQSTKKKKKKKKKKSTLR